MALRTATDLRQSDTDRGSPARHPPQGLRRLRWLGYGLPIVALIAIEVFRFAFVERDPLHQAEHLAVAAVAAVGILAFASMMFRLIEQAEERVVRQNRELTAINAVSTAVQGELAVEQIIDAALEVVVERTGATEASVLVFDRSGSRNGPLERRVVHGAHASIGSIGEAMPHLVEVPLAHGTVIVGRMRLHLATEDREPDLLASATLNNIGHQLACSIEIGQLIGDLQRRESEDRGLYDVLLRISSQKPLAETLGALVRHARDVLRVEAVKLCLTPTAALLIDGVQPSGGTSLVRIDDGAVHIVAGCPIAGGGNGAGDEPVVRIPLVSPDLTLGELCVGPRSDTPLSEREWGFVHRTAELAVIAISSTRMREQEKQVSILAERERIAREMHDSLAQVLGYIHLNLRALRGKVTQVEPSVLAASMAELADVAEDAYRDVREAILGLRESSRAGRSLFENLRAFLERYEHQATITTRFETDFDEPPPLSPQAEIHVIRVIQEALTNIRKHARARHAVVRVSSAPGAVVFSVEDDGRGFDITDLAVKHDGGFGLQSMRERMELIGGTLSIESAPRKGTRVIARVPLASTVPAALDKESHGAAV